jgi:hypothetical protein
LYVFIYAIYSEKYLVAGIPSRATAALRANLAAGRGVSRRQTQ